MTVGCSFYTGQKVGVESHPNEVFEIVEFMPETRVALDSGKTLVYAFESDLVAVSAV